MKTIERSISGLYYRYKKNSDDQIRHFLDKVKIAYYDDQKNAYLPLDDKTAKSIYDDPRHKSLTFDVKLSPDPIKNLKVVLEFSYLVKSSSRFFLKPDIGEIIDQIPFEYNFDSSIKVLAYMDGHQLLDDTEGEHFIMKARLLRMT